jgi:hypothetical protein
MKLRLLGALSVIVALAVVTFGAVVSHAAPLQQRGVVYLAHPTQIAGAIAMGTILVVHDEAKMGSGEACTTIYQYESGKGPGREITKFSCTPVQRKVVDKFTVSCERQTSYGPTRIDLLTEYQFPGDAEAHGVPAR